MKKLSRMLQDVERIEATGGNVNKEGASPMFDSYCDFYHVFSESLERFKRGNGKERRIPPKLMHILNDAFAWGAINALRTLKHGNLLHDEAGNVVDRAFYSLEELLNEAEALLCPDCQSKDLERRLDALEEYNDEDDECDCDECECEDDEELF